MHGRNSTCWVQVNQTIITLMWSAFWPYWNPCILCVNQITFIYVYVRKEKPWLKKIIWVIGVLRRTVVSDWRFDNLCGSHLQSQVVVLVSWKFKNPGERFDWSIDRVAVGKYVMWLAVKTCAEKPLLVNMDLFYSCSKIFWIPLWKKKSKSINGKGLFKALTATSWMSSVLVTPCLFHDFIEGTVM